MKRGPRRQRSNGFLIHETVAVGAEPVGQRYMEGGGAVRACMVRARGANQRERELTATLARI